MRHTEVAPLLSSTGLVPLLIGLSELSRSNYLTNWNIKLVKIFTHFSIFCSFSQKRNVFYFFDTFSVPSAYKL